MMKASCQVLMVVYWKKKWKVRKLSKTTPYQKLRSIVQHNRTILNVNFSRVFFECSRVTIPESVFNRIIFFLSWKGRQASTISCCVLQLKRYFILFKYHINIYLGELWTRRGLSTPTFRITCPKFSGFCRLPETTGLTL